MLCTICEVAADEVSRETIPAQTEYEIQGEARDSVKYRCPQCELIFWVLEKVK